MEAEVLLGASLRVIAPTDQYDATKIVNWGINRWALKPELGYSERWGNWVLDALCRSVVLHHERGIRSGRQAAERKPDRLF